MDGRVKFYIPVAYPDQQGRRERLVCVGSTYCEYEERDKKTVEFCKANKQLPIVEAEFVCRERVSLNFMR